MRFKFPKDFSYAIVLMALCAWPVVAQNVRVDLARHSTRIPKVCQSTVAASIAGTIDIPMLVSEAICKGAGDMMADYTYTLNSAKREINKKGITKETNTTYEVFIPTLKSGTRAHGVLVVTSRNGVPVPADELAREQMKAGKRLEQSEDKIARESPAAAETNATSEKGMAPLGMYARSAVHRSAFGSTTGEATLAVQTFLKTSDLTFVRRASSDGRETLIFNFKPRPDAQFDDSEKYIAQLNGEIWIDAQDRIVTHIAGWPATTDATNKGIAAPLTTERPPAIYVEMMRLPEGIWLPRVTRINGADYPRLFNGIRDESFSTLSKYARFSTEIKDVKVNTPNER